MYDTASYSKDVNSLRVIFLQLEILEKIAAIPPPLLSDVVTWIKLKLGGTVSMSVTEPFLSSQVSVK